MRFVPSHKQTDGDKSSLPPAKWHVELVLISNQEGRDQFVCMERIRQFLAPALRDTCQMSKEQLTFFPNPRTRSGPPHTPLSAHPMRSLPTCPAAVSPTTPPPNAANTLRLHTRDPPPPAIKHSEVHPPPQTHPLSGTMRRHRPMTGSGNQSGPRSGLVHLDGHRPKCPHRLSTQTS